MTSTSSRSSDQSFLSKLLDNVEEDEQELLIEVEDLDTESDVPSYNRNLDISVSPLSERSNLDEWSIGLRTPILSAAAMTTVDEKQEDTGHMQDKVLALATVRNEEEIIFPKDIPGDGRKANADYSQWKAGVDEDGRSSREVRFGVENSSGGLVKPVAMSFGKSSEVSIYSEENNQRTPIHHDYDNDRGAGHNNSVGIQDGDLDHLHGHSRDHGPAHSHEHSHDHGHAHSHDHSHNHGHNHGHSHDVDHSYATHRVDHEGNTEEKADTPKSPPSLVSFEQIKGRGRGSGRCACAEDYIGSKDHAEDHPHRPNCGHLAVLHYDRVQGIDHVGFLVQGEMICFAPKTMEGSILDERMWSTDDQPVVMVDRCPIDVILSNGERGSRARFLHHRPGLLIDVEDNVAGDVGNLIHNDHEDVLVLDERGDLLVKSKDTGKIHGKLVRKDHTSGWWSDLFVPEKDAQGDRSDQNPNERDVLVTSVLSVKGVCCKSEVPAVVACCKQISGVVDANLSLLSQQIFLLHENDRFIPEEASKRLSQNQFPSKVVRNGVAMNEREDGATQAPKSSSNELDQAELKWNIALALVFWGLSWLQFVTLPEDVVRTKLFHWLIGIGGELDENDDLKLENFKYFALLAVALAFPQIAWKGYQSTRHMIIDVNVLMSVAVVGALSLQDFFEAATVVVIFSFSDYLGDRASQRARGALKSLMDLKPEMAFDEALGEISVEKVRVGQNLIVHSGGKIPVDGILIDDSCEVDESNLTGESKPVTKLKEDFLSAGTMNVSQFNFRMKSTALSRDSAVSRMIRLVEESTLLRSPMEQIVDRVARVYTPVMILLAIAVALIPWVFFDQSPRKWVKISLTLLVVACPCALVVSTPITYVCAVAQAARIGVLIKGGKYLETLANVDVICCDKTGTLTKGEFEVDEVLHLDLQESQKMMGVLGRIEQHAIHPISKAVFNYCEPYLLRQQQNEKAEVDIKRLEIIPGVGIKAMVRMDGKEDIEAFVVGEKARKSYENLAPSGGADEAESIIHPNTQRCVVSSLTNKREAMHVHDMDEVPTCLTVPDSFPESQLEQQRLVDTFVARQSGKTVSWLILNGRTVLGVAASDQLRPEAIEALADIKQMGIKIIVLTGDNQGAAQVLKSRLESLVDEMDFSLKPEEKVEHVRRLKQIHYGRKDAKKHTVCVLGDGVNDAPAFSAADVGVAMAYGAPLALESADCALMDNDLRKLPELLRLARRTRRTIIQNLVFSFVSKVIVLGFTLAGMMTLGLAVATDVGAMLIVTINGVALINFKSSKEVSETGHERLASHLIRRSVTPHGQNAGTPSRHSGTSHTSRDPLDIV